MKARKINAQEFKKQIEEYVVGDGVVEIELNHQDSIKMQLTTMLDEDVDADREILDKLREAENDVSKTLAVVLNVDDQDADYAIELARDAGITKSDLFVIWGYQQREAQEQLGNFRFKESRS